MPDPKRNLRLVVCGGRLFGQERSEVDLLNATLDRIHRERGIACIVHGGCAGADNLAQRWAEKNGVECIAVIANWYQEGRSAGPKRNRRMLTEYGVDGVVAVKGGSGTNNCCEQAESLGIVVWRVGW